MKTRTKKMILMAVVIFTATFISWNPFAVPKKEMAHRETIQTLSENDLYAMMDEDDWTPSPGPKTIIPAAEDVLIQRIPGDKNHLLMMAFYSKENYSGQFVTLNNYNGLLFRDDGKGDDKKAGDGL